MAEPDEYLTKLTLELAKYSKKRLGKGSSFVMCSALTEESEALEPLFALVVQTGDQLIMVHLAPPMLSRQGIEEYLQELSPKVQTALSALASKPQLGLYIEGSRMEFRRSVEGAKLTISVIVCVPEVFTYPMGFGVPIDLDVRVVFLSEFLGLIDEIDGPKELGEFLEYVADVEKSELSPM